MAESNGAVVTDQQRHAQSLVEWHRRNSEKPGRTGDRMLDQAAQRAGIADELPFRWLRGDPPPPERRRTKWQRALDLLHAHPGRWADIGVHGGVPKALRTDPGIEVVARLVPGDRHRRRFYVRSRPTEP